MVSLWEPLDGHLVARAQGHDSFVSSVVFDPWHDRDALNTYRIISVGEDKRVCFWDFNSATMNHPCIQGLQGGLKNVQESVSPKSTQGASRHVPAPMRASVPMLRPTIQDDLQGMIPVSIRLSAGHLLVLHPDGQLDVLERPQSRPVVVLEDAPLSRGALAAADEAPRSPPRRSRPLASSIFPNLRKGST